MFKASKTYLQTTYKYFLFLAENINLSGNQEILELIENNFVIIFQLLAQKYGIIIII